MASLQFRIALV